MDPAVPWLRLACKECGAHTVVAGELAAGTLCPICASPDLELVAAEAEAPATARTATGAGQRRASGSRRFLRGPRQPQRA